MKFPRLVALLVFLLGVMWARPVGADDRRAGLMVVYGPHDVHETCVTFSDEAISGSALLSRAGLGVISVSEADGGTVVCRIAQVGCSFPEEDCRCQCGDPCVAWHHWVWQGDAWEPFAGSPTERWVRSGDLDAWVWGTADDPPPELNGQGPCGSLPAVPQVVAQQESYPEPPDPPPPDEPYPGEAATAVPQATFTPRPTATTMQTGTVSPVASPTPERDTVTPTDISAPPTLTPTLERVELPTEADSPPATEMADETPDAGATLVVQAATRGAAAPTDVPRPDPDAPVPVGRLAGAAVVILVVVLGAVWWRRQASRVQGPPEA